jgi:hypothetical protein
MKVKKDIDVKKTRNDFDHLIKGKMPLHPKTKEKLDNLLNEIMQYGNFCDILNFAVFFNNLPHHKAVEYRNDLGNDKRRVVQHIINCSREMVYSVEKELGLEL